MPAAWVATGIFGGWAVNGKLLPGVKLEDGSFAAEGVGGNYLVVIPSRKLVIVHRANTGGRPPRSSARTCAAPVAHPRRENHELTTNAFHRHGCCEANSPGQFRFHHGATLTWSAISGAAPLLS